MMTVKFQTICVFIITLGVSSCAMQPKSIAPPDEDTLGITLEPLSKTGNVPYDVEGKIYIPLLTAYSFEEKGQASWYGEPFHGRKTSNGEVYDMYEVSAAHKTLPLPSHVKVTNLANGESLVVRVNDRGPFVGDRVIDLSYAAAKKLGFIKQGVTDVYIKAINPEKPLQSPENVGLVAKLPEIKAAYYIQAGAFQQIENATLMQADLTQAGYQSKIESDPEANLYKLKVGPFEDPEVAYEQASIIKKKLNTSSSLITN